LNAYSDSVGQVVGGFTFRDVILPQAGAYSIDVRIGELAHETIPLYVSRRE
jgi:hypothetical protein